MPDPEPLPLDQTLEVARWAVDARRRRGGAAISSSASMAVRIASAARGAGLDLEGVLFSIGGEPLTRAKAERDPALPAPPASPTTTCPK